MKKTNNTKYKILLLVFAFILIINTVHAEGESIYLQLNTSGDSTLLGNNTGNFFYQAETFDYNESANKYISNVSMHITSVTNGGVPTCFVMVVNTTGGAPTGEVIANSSPVACNSVGFINFILNPINNQVLIPNTKYAIVLNTTDALAGTQYSRITYNNVGGTLASSVQYQKSITGAWVVGDVGYDLNLTLYIKNSSIVVSNDTINFSNIQPSNNTQFNLNNLTFNVSAQTSNVFNCSLYINGTLNQSTGSIAPANPANVRFNQTIGEGTWNYKITCSDIENVESTSTNTFYVDTINPLAVSNFVNLSFYAYANITGQWNLSDEQILSSINVTIDNNVIFNTSLSSRSYSYNLTYNPQLLSLGSHVLRVRVADGHTAAALKQDYDIIKDKEIIFKPEKDSYFIRIKEDKNKQDIWQTERLIDRYSYTYTPAEINNNYTFEIGSNKEIRIIEADWTEYKKWLIIGDQWLDFMIENENPSITFEQKNKNKVLVTISGLKDPSKIKFNSIGDLNVITYTYNLTTTNASVTYSSAILETEINRFTFIINKSGSVNYTNASFIWNGTIQNISKVTNSDYDNYTSSFITPVVANSLNITFIWFYNITGNINNESGNITKNQSILDIGVDNCTSFGVVVKNYTIRQLNNSLITGYSNAFLTFWVSDPAYSQSVNLTWQNTNNPRICINPVSANFTSNLQMEYGASGYSEKTYYKDDYTLDNITDNEILYLTEGVTNVTLTVDDENDNPVEDVDIYVMVYDLGTNTSQLVEIVRTDSAGEGISTSIIYNTQFYKFILYYQGSIVLETSPVKITSSPRNFRINLQEDYFITYNKVQDVSCRVSFANATKTYTFVYLDPSATITNACLKVVRQSINGETEIGETCQTNTSGSININIGNATGTNTYIGTGSISYTNQTFICGEPISVSFDNRYQTFGLNGLLWAFMIILTMILIGIWDPRVSVILGIVGLVGLVITGFFFLTWPVLVGILIVAGIYVIKLNR